MTESQFYLVVLLLVFLAYQVWRFRLESRERFAIRRADAARANLDAEILRMCPNITSSVTLPELRTWQAVILRKDEHFRGWNRGLMNPISDEPSTCYEIYLAFLTPAKEDPNFPMPAKATEDEATFLTEAWEATERFTKVAGEQGVLTPSEIAFLTYWEWRKHLLADGEKWERPSKMFPYFLSQVLDRELARFTKGGTTV